MITYKLYEVRLIKGILMYDWIGDEVADNIIEAEYLFEKADKIAATNEYVITISKS